MIRTVLVGLAFVVGGVVATTGHLSAQSDASGIVKERQDLMKSMGKSFGPLVAILKGESTDLNAAAAAARTMGEGMGKASGMFPEGTAKGEAAESRAKPEIWTQGMKFETAAKALVAEAAKLASVADSGDIDAFKAQFQMTAKACGGCHEGKPKAGGDYRFPKDE
jgi:cytochrome c556